MTDQLDDGINYNITLDSHEIINAYWRSNDFIIMKLIFANNRRSLERIAVPSRYPSFMMAEERRLRARHDRFLRISKERSRTGCKKDFTSSSPPPPPPPPENHCELDDSRIFRGFLVLRRSDLLGYVSETKSLFHLCEARCYLPHKEAKDTESRESNSKGSNARINSKSLSVMKALIMRFRVQSIMILNYAPAVKTAQGYAQIL